MGFKLKDNLYMIEEFEKFGIEAGYGTKDFTLPNLKEYAQKNGKVVVSGIQTHSSNIVVIKKGEELDMTKLPFSDTDGLITDREDLFLYTKHADCQCIYFFDIKKSVVGICHSGWKGSFDEICIKMIKLLEREFRSEIEDLIIGIGIGISALEYEVSHEFMKNFAEKFGKKIIEKSFLEQRGKIFFDNEKFNIEILKKYNIKEKQIVVSEECTFKNNQLHSYRRDKETSGRNFAFIQIIKNRGVKDENNE